MTGPAARDLARALIEKLDRERRQPSYLQATVLEVMDDDDEAVILARVHIDGNPPDAINVVPVVAPVRLIPGQRVLVSFDPPAGAYIIGTVTRGVGGAVPYATRVVAASNSVATNAQAADYVCAGADDDLTIAEALDSLTFEGADVGGRVLLLEGDYFCSTGGIVVAGDPSYSISDGRVRELAGLGPGTRLWFDGPGYGVLVPGGVLRDVMLIDDGGVTTALYRVTARGAVRDTIAVLYGGAA